MSFWDSLTKTFAFTRGNLEHGGPLKLIEGATEGSIENLKDITLKNHVVLETAEAVHGNLTLRGRSWAKLAKSVHRDTTLLDTSVAENVIGEKVYVGIEAKVLGDIKAGSDVHIDGTVGGRIQSKGNVYVGKTAQVDSNRISAPCGLVYFKV